MHLGCTVIGCSWSQIFFKDLGKRQGIFKPWPYNTTSSLSFLSLTLCSSSLKREEDRIVKEQKIKNDNEQVSLHYLILRYFEKEWCVSLKNKPKSSCHFSGLIIFGNQLASNRKYYPNFSFYCMLEERFYCRRGKLQAWSLNKLWKSSLTHTRCNPGRILEALLQWLITWWIWAH